MRRSLIKYVNANYIGAVPLPPADWLNTPLLVAVFRRGERDT
jgi:hypothetical protein